MENVSVRDFIREFKTLCSKPLNVLRNGEVLGQWIPKGAKLSDNLPPESVRQPLVRQENDEKTVRQDEVVRHGESKPEICQTKNPWHMHTVIQNGRTYSIPGTPEEQGVVIPVTKYIPKQKGTLGESIDASPYLSDYKHLKVIRKDPISSVDDSKTLSSGLPPLKPVSIENHPDRQN